MALGDVSKHNRICSCKIIKANFIQFCTFFYISIVLFLRSQETFHFYGFYFFFYFFSNDLRKKLGSIVQTPAQK